VSRHTLHATAEDAAALIRLLIDNHGLDPRYWPADEQRPVH
jgi:hypothetical protein